MKTSEQFSTAIDNILTGMRDLIGQPVSLDANLNNMQQTSTGLHIAYALLRIAEALDNIAAKIPNLEDQA